VAEYSPEDRPLFAPPDGRSESALPSTHRALLPRWPAVTTIGFGLALIVAGHCLSAWILNLNAYRAVAETLAASMARSDAAYRAGRPRQPRIDPLNPATWSLESAADGYATEQERRHTQEAAKQIGVVEVGVKIWKLAVWGIGAIIVALALAALKAQRRRAGLLVATAALGLLATALTVAGMRVLVVHGGFQPRPAGDYITVAVAGSAYAWALLAYLVRFRAGARTRRPGGREITHIEQEPL